MTMSGLSCPRGGSLSASRLLKLPAGAPEGDAASGGAVPLAAGPRMNPRMGLWPCMGGPRNSGADEEGGLALRIG